MAPREITRSPSASTLSCITVREDDGDAFSAAPSTTPPTSNTDDASSASIHAAGKPEAHRSRGTSATKNRRAGHAEDRSGIKEQPISTKDWLQKGGEGGSRTVSGETLVEHVNGSEQRLVQESIQMLDLDWSVDAMPGDEMKKVEPANGMKRTKSTRLELLERATSIISTATTTLGKRRREAMDVGREKLQALKGDRRASLRPRGNEDRREPSFEGPLKKKARFMAGEMDKAETIISTAPRKFVPKPKIKRWLTQGLYIGQDRDFDPRFTEAKNKLKKASKRAGDAKQNAILPLPMFAGQRLLNLGRDFKLPFEVFSPLPPGQPKPEEWKRTQKNVFVGDAANIWKNTKLQEHSTCICTPESGCDEDCFNRFMFYECDDSNCSIGAEHCTNRSFEGLRKRCKAGGRYNIGVEVIKTMGRGYGVRSNRTFEPNQIIVEYAGEIITQEECEDRMRKRYKDNECYYLMLFDQNMIIDATRGSIARFVNHSCEPNCTMTKWTVAGKPRMALFAGDKGIMTGEELTYDYNFDPFSVKNVQECRCGATSCRGVLGPKPKDQPKAKELKDLMKPILGGTKRKLQQALDDTIENVTKKRKLAVPNSVKAALHAAKAHKSKELVKAKVYSSTSRSNNKLVKKVSSRSLASSRESLQRSTTMSRLSAAVKKHTPVTYGRRRSSLSLSSARAKESDERPLGRRDSVKAVAASVRRNVVRTVRGSGRAAANGGGRSIRVIGGEDE